MKPVKFEGCNTTIAKDQPEYIALPAKIDEGIESMVTTLWKASFKERLKFLFTGKMWVYVLTFKKPFPPIKFEI